MDHGLNYEETFATHKRQVRLNFALKAVGFALACTAASTLFPGVVALNVFVGTLFGATIFQGLRNMIKHKSYENYATMKRDKIDDLSLAQQRSFTAGTRAAKSTKVMMLSCFKKDTLLNPQAYYAGFDAKLNQDNKLMRKVRGY